MVKVAMLLCLTAVCYRRVTGARVGASYSPRPATEGPHPYTVSCSYTVDSGEHFRIVKMNLISPRKSTICNVQTVDRGLVSRPVSNAKDLQDRSAVCSGSVSEQRIQVRVPDTRCSDAGTIYVCELEISKVGNPRAYVLANVTIAVEAPDPVTASDGDGQPDPQVTEGTEVAYTCTVNVGSPPAVITWFTSNTRTGPVTSVTNKAVFRPVTLRPNDVFCSERRESVLRLTLTCQQMGKTVYVRCLVDHPNKSLAPCTDPDRDFCRWGPTLAIKHCDYIPTVAPGEGAGSGHDQYGDDYGDDDVTATSPAPRDHTTPILKNTTGDSGKWTLTLFLVVLGVMLGTAGTVVLVSLLVHRAQRVNRGAGSAGLSPEQQGVYTVSLPLQDDAGTPYSWNSGRTVDTGGNGGSQYTASTGDTESDATESVGSDNTPSDVDY